MTRRKKKDIIKVRKRERGKKNIEMTKNKNKSEKQDERKDPRCKQLLPLTIKLTSPPSLPTNPHYPSPYGHGVGGGREGGGGVSQPGRCTSIVSQLEKVRLTKVERRVRRVSERGRRPDLPSGERRDPRC